ncbi:putative disease resistance RPP8-like protein 4-like protein [Corchorus olitorius]|uniref:Disease resistance RPP8-like protein 4-like protein n=1 Tax=Corchorus olitorius TaxID=93759 RepID=A0A1R3JM12_9ROSI|nr:putative disease resistance RPP8-like protein 4-like protein [Corchorus olitorius]
MPGKLGCMANLRILILLETYHLSRLEDKGQALGELSDLRIRAKLSVSCQGTVTWQLAHAELRLRTYQMG